MTVIRLDGAFAGPAGGDDSYWILTIMLREAFIPIHLDRAALDGLGRLLDDARAGTVRWTQPVMIGAAPAQAQTYTPVLPSLPETQP